LHSWFVSSPGFWIFFENPPGASNYRLECIYLAIRSQLFLEDFLSVPCIGADGSEFCAIPRKIQVVIIQVPKKETTIRQLTDRRPKIAAAFCEPNSITLLRKQHWVAGEGPR